MANVFKKHSVSSELAQRMAYGGGFPIQVDGEVVGAIGVSGAPTVQNDIDCARAALALVLTPLNSTEP
jgi:uncharacterized protein GlcG (DUF336 family)